MRLWSFHPKYLDSKGLIALWRETLLAKKVLQGNTKGYKNHPQLERFKTSPAPIAAINYYLKEILNESQNRDYRFDASKIGRIRPVKKILVTSGQLQYEWSHFKQKLKKRGPERLLQIQQIKNIEIHPLFKQISGNVMDWEKTDH